jgi:hypothetical protein
MSSWKHLMNDQDNTSRPSETRLNRYIKATYDQWLATLPIFFDRISSMASPLYGFSFDNKWSDQHPHLPDWNVLVDDFLRRQERIGGPHTAVAIVLDAQSTQNIHFEQGFHLSDYSINQNMTDLRVLWPAIYMRSTMHLSPTSTRTAKSSLPAGSGLLRMNAPATNSSTSSLRSNRSLEKLTPRQRILQPQTFRALEYGPDSGNTTTFPHNEWQTLVSLLPHHLQATTVNVPSPPDTMEAVVSGPADAATNELAKEPVVVTYQDQDAKDTRESSGTLEEVVGLFSVLSSDPSPDKAAMDDSPKSVFHMVTLGDYLSMAVIVKGEEETRWHRRRARLPDEEIRLFLNELSGKLRVSTVFTIHALPDTKDRTRPSLHLPDQTNWKDKDVKDFLKHIKGSFGLRPVSSLPDGFSSSEFGSGVGGFYRRLMPWKSAHYYFSEGHQQALQESAANLFLGRELADLLHE